jgi:hypothetical protein
LVGIFAHVWRVLGKNSRSMSGGFEEVLVVPPVRTAQLGEQVGRYVESDSLAGPALVEQVIYQQLIPDVHGNGPGFSTITLGYTSDFCTLDSFFAGAVGAPNRDCPTPTTSGCLSRRGKRASCTSWIVGDRLLFGDGFISSNLRLAEKSLKIRH